jgi:hypothetical protein
MAPPASVLDRFVVDLGWLGHATVADHPGTNLGHPPAGGGLKVWSRQ